MTITISAPCSTARGHVLEQRDRLPVGPMEVIEHHAQRLRARDRQQQLSDRFEQQEPLGLRIGGLRRGRIRHPASEIARQPADLAAVRRNVSGEHVARRMLDQLRADLDPRLIRRRRDPPMHAPQQTANPSRVRAERRIRSQPRLPDPRLAGHKHHLTRARPRLRARALQQRPLDHPADIRHPRHRPQRRRQRPRARRAIPDSSASGSQTTANASIGSGIPFSSNSPTDSNRAPSTRPASNFVAGETRIPSAGALSHNRAASIAGIPK